TAARGATDRPPSLDDSAPSLPQMFETPVPTLEPAAAEASSSETSFADLNEPAGPRPQLPALPPPHALEPTPPPRPPTPAAADGSAVTPRLPTAAGFELTPPVRRFVDDWLRAQETHDAPLFSALGFRELPTELVGSFNTRDTYRLVAADVDEERSTPDLVYLRLVVSYAFRDDTGRFRTEDEERVILRSTNGILRFEGRWQQ
ncbi:MAG TPA: hypothetical protein VKF60_09240, partial [Myxococcota bacterium]|nr:hypothetical protein [Myxococcota bacterium]